MIRRVTAARAHQIPDRAPLRVAPGERVHAGERSEEWPAFVFVTAQHGEGWVPSRHLSRPSGEAVVRVAYDTTELPTEAGEELAVMEEDSASGWLWCRARSGREGWVPAEALRSAE